MTHLYELIWQVQADRPDLARKSCHLGIQPALSHDEILDGFLCDPEVIDLGDELVIWQRLPTGTLAAEGWRKIVENKR